MFHHHHSLNDSSIFKRYTSKWMSLTSSSHCYYRPCHWFLLKQNQQPVNQIRLLVSKKIGCKITSIGHTTTVVLGTHIRGGSGSGSSSVRCKGHRCLVTGPMHQTAPQLLRH